MRSIGYTAHVNFRGEKHYVGWFKTKAERTAAMKAFRESMPLEVCPCGGEFVRPMRARHLIQFCPKHRRVAALLRYRWGLTNEVIAAILPLRDDGCEICGSHFRLALDHDHATGELRGWLCFNCNTILGMVKEDPERLKRLIEYIKGDACQ